MKQEVEENLTELIEIFKKMWWKVKITKKYFWYKINWEEVRAIRLPALVLKELIKKHK